MFHRRQDLTDYQPFIADLLSVSSVGLPESKRAFLEERPRRFAAAAVRG